MIETKTLAERVANAEKNHAVIAKYHLRELLREAMAEIERLQRQYGAVKTHAVSQDCGRLCDTNPALKYREVWKNSERVVEAIARSALADDVVADESEGS